MQQQVQTGFEVGNGAAINVELGYIPDFVMVFNVTDGDLLTMGFLNDQVIPFSSGGTNEIEAGDKVIGATSGAEAIVKEVKLYSGSWAGGDAAGFLIVGRDSIVGTFQSEAIYAEDSAATDDATATANVTHSIASAAAVATASGNAAVTAYAGSSGSASKGFTIGSTVAEEAKLLRWVAFRDG